MYSVLVDKMKSSIGLTILVMLAVIFFLADKGWADAGDLDPTFDGDGIVITDFAASYDEAFAVAIQSDGKIVAVGAVDESDANDFAVARYNSDGSLDPTFDGDGKVTTDFAGHFDYGKAVAIQSDGKIVVAGYTIDPVSSSDFALARYNADGSLDTTFGIGGKVTTDFIGNWDQATSIAIQNDGKIVVAGWACLRW